MSTAPQENVYRIVREDDSDVPGECKPKHSIHSQGDLHREVDVFVINHYGLLLHEKIRKDKEGKPFQVVKWNHIGGHVEEEDFASTKTQPEVWRNAARREFEEEIGVRNEDTRNRVSEEELAALGLDDLVGVKCEDFHEVACYRRHTSPDQGSQENNNRILRGFLLDRDIRIEQINHPKLMGNRPSVVGKIRYWKGLELAQLLGDPDMILAGTPYVLSAIPYLNALMVSRCLLWGQHPSNLPYIYPKW